MGVKDELCFHFDVLWDYFINIEKTNNDINFLPITKYSGLIFRLYLKSILLSINYDNYCVYVDDFIVYGTDEECEKTFDIIFHILKNNERQLSTFSIYNKLIHNSMVFLNQEYKFDRIDINEDQSLNIEISLKTNHDGVYLNNILTTMFRNHLNNDLNLNIGFIETPTEVENCNICEICRSNKKNLCLSCGHLLCNSCFMNIKTMALSPRCPFCESSLKTFAKIFL